MDLLPNTLLRTLQALPGAACACARGEGLWVGVALLTLARVADAGPAELRGMPAGSETFIEREPIALAAPLPAPAHGRAGGSAAAAMRASEGASAEPLKPPPVSGAVRTDPLDLSLGPLRDPFGMPDLGFAAAPSEFRPRSPAVLRVEPPSKAEEDPLMSDSGTWQRLAREYRGQRRLRVLTIWDAGWSSLSLQAGRHGDPSLQWTGHLPGHSETHRGVLDLWIPSFSGAGALSRGVAHALTNSQKAPSASIAHVSAAPP